MTLPEPMDELSYKVLVLHSIPAASRQTILDHVFCYPRYRPGVLYAYHHLMAPPTPGLAAFPFDAIILNYCFLSHRTTGRYQWCKERYAFVRESDAVKIAIAQDELMHGEVLDEWLQYMKIDVIYTPVRKHLDVLYPSCHKQAKIKHAFAGFAKSNGELDDLARFVTPLDQRAIDVGDRVRFLPPYFGRLGRIKGMVAERFAAAAQAAGLAVDISTRPQDVLSGTEWFQFLGSCRFTLASHGGGSVFDPRGEIKRLCLEYELRHPSASFEEIEAVCFADLDCYDFSAITPRLFEAAALRTGLILVDDDYKYIGGIKAYEHYIPLAADFSNIEEVFALMREDSSTERMIEAAYQVLVAEGRFSYRAFVEDVFGEIEAARPAPKPVSDAYITGLCRHYEALGPSQHLLTDVPPQWGQALRQIVYRAKQRGQLAGIRSLAGATQRGAATRSVVATELECHQLLDPSLTGSAAIALSRLAADRQGLAAIGPFLASADAVTDGIADWNYCDYIFEKTSPNDSDGEAHRPDRTGPLGQKLRQCPRNRGMYKVLVLHALRGDTRQTMIDHAYCYPRYRSGVLYAYHNLLAPVTDALASFPFDAIIINYCFLAYRVLDDTRLNALKEKYAFVRHSSAYKIAIPQDDYTCNGVLDDWLAEMDADVIYSAVLKDLDVLYPRGYRSKSIKHAFTGYANPKDLAELARYRMPFGERSIDVGTRVRYSLPHYGRLGILKARCAEEFRDIARTIGLNVDISTRPEDVFLGTDWYRFLGSCRFTFITKGGASIADPRGELKARVLDYQKRHPRASFEEIEAACFEGQDRYDFSAITPRIFEAAALHTGLIMLRDSYVDGLEPYVHYIPLDADFSNIEEVAALIRDDERSAAMIDAAYRLLVESGRFGYNVFVDDVFSEIEKARPAPRPVTDEQMQQLHHHYEALAGHQHLLMEAPPHLGQLARLTAHRARHAGQLGAFEALLTARQRGSAGRSVVAAEIECESPLDQMLRGLGSEALSRLAGHERALAALTSFCHPNEWLLTDWEAPWGFRFTEWIFDTSPPA